MSKTEENVQQPAPAPAAPQKKSFVDDLKKNGSVVLTAKTRDELTEMVNNIPADVKYGAGAVCQNLDNGLFCLQIFVTN